MFWHSLRASVASLEDLEIGRERATVRRRYFTKVQAQSVFNAANEPYQTMFTLAWCTGLRAGEILALTVDDLHFANRTINVNNSADDHNRSIGQTKTETSTALPPTSSLLTTVPKNDLEKRWQDNPRGLLFPNRNKNQ